MDNFTEIQQLWQSAPVAGLPRAAEIVRTIKAYRNRQLLKVCGVFVAVAAIAALLVWILLYYHSTLLTTRIGEACYFIALIFIIWANTQYLRRIAKASGISNTDFITYLKVEQQKQMHFFKRTQVIGFAISAIGLALYMYEPVHNSLLWTVITYLAVGIYVVVMWFVVRPMTMKRKMAKLSATITQLEELSTQLSNN